MNTLLPSPQRSPAAVRQSTSSSSSSSGDGSDFREVLSHQVVQGKGGDNGSSSSSAGNTGSARNGGDSRGVAARGQGGPAVAAPTAKDPPSADGDATSTTTSAAARGKTKENAGNIDTGPATQALIGNSTAADSQTAAAVLSGSAAASAAASSAASATVSPAPAAPSALASTTSTSGAMQIVQSTMAQASQAAGAVLPNAAAVVPKPQDGDDEMNPDAMRSSSEGDLDSSNPLGASSKFSLSDPTETAAHSFKTTVLALSGAEQKNSGNAFDDDAGSAGSGNRATAAVTQGTSTDMSIMSAVPTLPSQGAAATPQPAIATATVPYQVGSDAWRADVSSHVLYFTQQDIQVAQLHLNPQHLGPLNIEIRVAGNQASVALNAAHETTRQALTDTLPQLHEMFTAHGVQLGGATVGDQPGGSSQSPAGSGSSGGQNVHYGQNHSFSGGSPAESNGVVGISKVQVRSLSMIDTFA